MEELKRKRRSGKDLSRRIRFIKHQIEGTRELLSYTSVQNNKERKQHLESTLLSWDRKLKRLEAEHDRGRA